MNSETNNIITELINNKKQKIKKDGKGKNKNWKSRQKEKKEKNPTQYNQKS